MGISRLKILLGGAGMTGLHLMMMIMVMRIMMMTTKEEDKGNQ